MNEYTNSQLNDLIFNALVPKGLRPETPEAIDAMLDAFDGEPLSEDTAQRMLRKAMGQEPFFQPDEESSCEDIPYCENEIQVQESDLVLYRNQAEEIPEDIQKQLDQIEEEALEENLDSHVEEDEDDE